MTSAASRPATDRAASPAGTKTRQVAAGSRRQYKPTRPKAADMGR